MKFSSIVGHQKLKSQLINLSGEGRISHAILFCEDQGYGALSIAIAFAQYNSCPNRDGHDSCGNCSTCNKFQKLIHPDLHFALPVNNTKKITSDKKPVSDHFIETWRSSIIENPNITEQEWYDKIGVENKLGLIGVNEANLILKKLSLRSFEGGDKYVIVWLPERMNHEAANKLLKLIEEPPAGTYLFLVSQAPEKIIPTILSRCQIIRVAPLEIEELGNRLSQEFSISPEDGIFWAKIAGGSISKAREIIRDSIEVSNNQELLIRLFEGCVAKDMVSVISVWEEIAMSGREKQKQFCYYALEFIRRVYMMSLGVNEISNTPTSQRDTISLWAKKIKPSFYSRGYDAINGALADIDRNVNSKYIFSDLSNRFFLSL
ncbi:MAG: hypothetical protein ABFC28_01175 [Rikenellaceae bacterium]